MKKFLFNLYHHLIVSISKRKNKQLSTVYSITALKNSLPTRNQQYHYFHHYFWNLSPNWLKEHREYFIQDKRGFGEDAFHAMWYFVFTEFHPTDILEIGVYRGQTLSLFSLLSKNNGVAANIHGVSPFTSAGDAVSKYSDETDYYFDVITNFNHFNLPLPVLHRGFSTDEGMLPVIQSKKWDLIYIDGNHDYGVAKYDFTIAAQNVKKGGLIVLDDASLNTDFTPPVYSTAGHLGPSKLASEIDSNLFEEILSAGHNRVFKKI